MRMFFSVLDTIWLDQPNKVFLQSAEQTLSYQEFKLVVQNYAKQLEQWQAKSVALLADNSMQWLAVDFACQLLNIAFLPLPGFLKLPPVIFCSPITVSWLKV